MDQPKPAVGSPKASQMEKQSLEFGAPLVGPLKRIHHFWEKGITRPDSFLLMMLRSLRVGAKELETKIIEVIAQELKVDESSAYRVSLLPFFQELNTAFE